jgi:hypothetical protein
MAWQYCECGRGLSPETEDILVGTITCTCGQINNIAYLDEERAELLKQMYRDIEELKKHLHFMYRDIEEIKKHVHFHAGMGDK